jgi:hypothetical protein
MLIIVPSYKRSECLHWVLKSIYQCEVSEITEKKRIVVVNNHPPSREIVDRIVGAFACDTTIACHTLHRKETIAATDNWFSAVSEFAAEGETVVFLGDDDLMLPWGLQSRIREIKFHQADMLLSDFADRIYFFDKGRKYWMSGPMPSEANQATSACSWDFYPAKHPEASFIGNHCYRNTPGFRRGLELAFAWCDSQAWLDRKVRTSMLLFYLPYAITLAGGKVISLHAKCVLRGASADEAIQSTYSEGGNVIFFNLCAYDVFANRGLPKYTERLALVCAHFERSIRCGFLPMLFDKNVSVVDLAATLKHAGLGLQKLASTDLLRGLPRVAIDHLGLRGGRLRLLRRSGSLQETESLFSKADG